MHILVTLQTIINKLIKMYTCSLTVTNKTDSIRLMMYYCLNIILKTLCIIKLLLKILSFCILHFSLLLKKIRFKRFLLFSFTFLSPVKSATIKIYGFTNIIKVKLYTAIQ